MQIPHGLTPRVIVRKIFAKVNVILSGVIQQAATRELRPLQGNPQRRSLIAPDMASQVQIHNLLQI